MRSALFASHSVKRMRCNVADEFKALHPEQGTSFSAVTVRSVAREPEGNREHVSRLWDVDRHNLIRNVRRASLASYRKPRLKNY